MTFRDLKFLEKHNAVNNNSDSSRNNNQEEITGYTGDNNHNDKANKEHCNGSNKITALVTFERGDRVRARFTFELIPVESNESIICLKNKIQSLNIQFIR